MWYSYIMMRSNTKANQSDQFSKKESTHSDDCLKEPFEIVFFWSGPVVQPGGISGGIIYERQLFNGLQQYALETNGWIKPTLVDVYPTFVLWPLAKERDPKILQKMRSMGPYDVAIFDGISFLDFTDVLPEIEATVITLTHFPISQWPGLPIEVKNDLIEREKIFLKSGTVNIVAGEFSLPYMKDIFGLDESEGTVLNIPAGIDAEIFCPPTSARQVPKVMIEFLIVANWFPHKGQHTILKALQKVKNTKLEWSLTMIAGEIIYDEAFSKKVRALISTFPEEKVTVLGVLSPQELVKYYQRSHALLSGSIFENYGMVFAEALATNLPIIGVRTGALNTDLCAARNMHASPCSLSSVNDIDQLVANIGKFLDNPAPLLQAAKRPMHTRPWDEFHHMVLEAITVGRRRHHKQGDKCVV